MRVFHPRDWTRIVGASQCGHLMPLGRIRRKNAVAAMIRRMKKATKMTPNHTASDMGPSRPHGRPATAERLQPLLDDGPGLDPGPAVFHALDDHLRAFRKLGIVERSGTGGVPAPAVLVRDLVCKGPAIFSRQDARDARRMALQEIALVHHLGGDSRH